MVDEQDALGHPMDGVGRTTAALAEEEALIRSGAEPNTESTFSADFETSPTGTSREDLDERLQELERDVSRVEGKLDALLAALDAEVPTDTENSQ